MGGLALIRVKQFRTTVTNQQLEKTSDLFTNHARPTLYEIAKLGLPQFSKISFISKVRMYLDPLKSATLDRQIMQIHNDTVLAAIKEDKTSIPINKGNSIAYERWCEHLAHIAQTYLPTARVVDIERGLFHMIQTGRVKEAASILKTA